MNANLDLIHTALLTTRANCDNEVNVIHDVSVVIIPLGDFEAWLEKLIKLCELAEEKHP